MRPMRQDFADLRAAKRENELRLASRLLLTPSAEERTSSSIPSELFAARWQLQPEYYAAKQMDSPMAAIAEAMSESNGNVFLVTENGGQLISRFHRTLRRLRILRIRSPGSFAMPTQMPTCATKCPKNSTSASGVFSCCGVGMLWYPSR